MSYNERQLTDYRTRSVFSEHRTADGTRISIFHLPDDHLANIIRMGFRAIDDVLSRGIELDIEKAGPIYTAMYGGDVLDAKEIAFHITGHIGYLQPYLLEAAIRNVNYEWNWAFVLLRTALGRTTHVGSNLLILEEGEISLRRMTKSKEESH